MQIQQEVSFKINDTESFVHCLVQHRLSCPEDPLRHYYHYHEYIELLYFASGEGYAYINDKQIPFSPGSLIIVNSKKAHYTHFFKAGKLICIKVLPQILYENEQPYLYFKYVMPFISDEKDYYVFSYEEMKNTNLPIYIEEILNEWDTMDEAYELSIRAKLLSIFVLIFRHWKNNGKSISARSITPEIAKALLYITDTYPTVNAKEVADKCGLSYNYFSTLFRQCVGTNFRDYLLNLKLQEAEKLLLVTSKSITDIALETGFSTTSHFVSRFQAKKGITPAKFRKSQNDNKSLNTSF